MANEPKEPAQNQQQPAVPPSGYPPPWAYYPPQDEIDLREYWKLVVENRKLIGIITGGCALIALIAAFVMTPIYRAETVLAPVSQDKTSGLAALAGQFGGLAELAGISLGGGNDTDESIATLKSRELTAEFVKKENILPLLFPSRWDEQTKTWTKHWWNLGAKDPAPTQWDAYKIFDEDIRDVSVDRKTNLVTLSVEWKDPMLAAKWANDLVKQVNDTRRQEAIEEADKSIHYLEEQLGKTGSVEVQQSIYKLIEAQTKKKMLASTQEEYAFKVIDPAVEPEEKVKPKRTLVVVLATLLGALLGVVVVLLRHIPVKRH
jgi:uncharacterized protein involved in exopolysaccharide biosynthesis